MNYEYVCFENVAFTKAMQILTDLNIKLLKIVTVNVLESNYNRKVSDEIANILKDSGEGQLFFIAGWCEEAIKKAVLEQTISAMGGAAVLHK